MDKAALKDLISYIELLLKQTDERRISPLLRQIRNLFKKSGAYTLPEIRPHYISLLEQQSIYEYFLTMAQVLPKLKAMQKKLEEEIQVEKYYPSSLRATRKTLETMDNITKSNRRVASKLKFIFERLSDETFRRLYSDKLLSRYSDLLVLKDGSLGTYTIRIIYYMESSHLFICALFSKHDDYEHGLYKKEFFKKNYKKELFLPIPRF